MKINRYNKEMIKVVTRYAILSTCVNFTGKNGGTWTRNEFHYLTAVLIIVNGTFTEVTLNFRLIFKHLTAYP